MSTQGNQAAAQEDQGLIKILIVGADKIGKTALAEKMFGIAVGSGEDNPIGAIIYRFQWSFGESQYNIELWDAKGGQQNGTVNSGLYNDTKVALIVVADGVKESIDLISFYHDNLKFGDGKILLVCTKNDIKPEESSPEIPEKSTKLGIELVNVSSITGENIEDLKGKINEALTKKEEPHGCCLIF